MILSYEETIVSRLHCRIILFISLNVEIMSINALSRTHPTMNKLTA